MCFSRRDEPLLFELLLLERETERDPLLLLDEACDLVCAGGREFDFAGGLATTFRLVLFRAACPLFAAFPVTRTSARGLLETCTFLEYEVDATGSVFERLCLLPAR